MTEAIHMYVACALALAFLFPSEYSYKSCWLYPLIAMWIPFYALGKCIDFTMNHRFE